MRQVAHQSGIIALADGTDATPKFANIAVNSSGDNTIVSAVASKKLRIISCFMIADGDVTAYIVDGANNAMIGDSSVGIDLTANSGFVLDFNPVGWQETAAGQTLDINLDGAVGVAGSLTYIEV